MINLNAENSSETEFQVKKRSKKNSVLEGFLGEDPSERSYSTTDNKSSSLSCNYKGAALRH